MISQAMAMTSASLASCPAGIARPHESVITPSTLRKYLNNPRYRNCFSAYFISCGRNNGAQRYALLGNAGMVSGPLGGGNGKRSGAHSAPCRGGILVHIPIRTSVAVDTILHHSGCAPFTFCKRHDAAPRSLRQASRKAPRRSAGGLMLAGLITAPAEAGQGPRRKQR